MVAFGVDRADAYPRFKRAVPVRELHEAFTPEAGEIAWAREQTRTPEHLLAVVVLLDAWRGARADLASAGVGREAVAHGPLGADRGLSRAVRVEPAAARRGRARPGLGGRFLALHERAWPALSYARAWSPVSLCGGAGYE